LGIDRRHGGFESVDLIEMKAQAIHMSKGREYHTIIFVGTHSLATAIIKNEKTNAFFVALSRAKVKSVLHEVRGERWYRSNTRPNRIVGES
jgi:hypothetical protein